MQLCESRMQVQHMPPQTAACLLSRHHMARLVSFTFQYRHAGWCAAVCLYHQLPEHVQEVSKIAVCWLSGVPHVPY